MNHWAVVGKEYLRKRRRARRWLAALLLAISSRALAQSAPNRTLDLGTNLFGEQIEQDPAGYVWFSSKQGLFRYDGNETRAISDRRANLVRGCVHAGRVIAALEAPEGYELVEVDDVTIRRLEIPVDAAMACAGDGALWMVHDGLVDRQRGDHPRERVFASGPADPLTSVWPGRGESVFVASRGEVSEMSPDGRRTSIAQLRGVAFAVPSADGAVLALNWLRDGAHLHRLAAGSSTELFRHSGRPMGLAMRRNVAWVALDTGLFGVETAPTAPKPTITLSTLGVGALLVDREEMVWAGTATEVQQYPEPDVQRLSPAPNVGSRWVSREGGAVVVNSWSGSYRVVAGDGSLALEPFVGGIGAVCIDGRGRRWSADFDTFTVSTASGMVRVDVGRRVGDIYPCATDASGALWIPSLTGLYKLEPNADRPVRVEALGEGVDSALLDSRGELWIGREGGDICRQHPGTDSLDRWSCEPLPRRQPVSGLIETESGAIWAVAEGVYRRDDGRWTALQAAAPSIRLSSAVRLARSPRGGVWVVGSGLIARVDDRTADSKLPVLESLGAWHGLLGTGASDLLEDDDGTVWLATADFLTRVPASARAAPSALRGVSITSIRTDDRERQIGPAFELGHDANRLEARYSAFSFRDPGRVRYRYRLREDQAWSRPLSDPVLRFYELATGRYRLTIEASLDDRNWTRTTAPIAFRVLPPWYAQPYVVAAAALAPALLAYGYHRLRVARLLALGRQRSRIAMDLHDAIGSGLGSIRILAGLAGRETTPEPARVELASRIATVSDELATALGDIVWSLRPGSGTIESLGLQLIARGSPLFEGRGIELETRFPAPSPEVRLSLAVRRHVFLIGIEALHNAARHSGASHVALAIERYGKRWQLRVEDDGHGMSREGERPLEPGRGLGLESIVKRAEEIGAEPRWSARPGGGTVFNLGFDAGAEDRRTSDPPTAGESSALGHRDPT
jgi:signal transduction histidine kinase/ligand-binding sensor domain-containing protein